MITTNPGCDKFKSFLSNTYGSAYHCSFIGIDNDVDNSIRPSNISEKSQQLLRWHRKLNHMNFPAVQQLARRHKIPYDIANAKIPICAECLYGKQHKRPKQFRGHIAKDNIKPGSVISGDHLEAGTTGLIHQTKGRRTKKRHKVATIWVDHFSDFISVHTQESTEAEQTVKAKLELETFAKRFNVHIYAYCTDNGTFTAKDFVEAVNNAGQHFTQCGVGAHWQNGIAERAIRSIV
jgi:hypothetical protein